MVQEDAFDGVVFELVTGDAIAGIIREANAAAVKSIRNCKKKCSPVEQD